METATAELRLCIGMGPCASVADAAIPGKVANARIVPFSMMCTMTVRRATSPTTRRTQVIQIVCITSVRNRSIVWMLKPGASLERSLLDAFVCAETSIQARGARPAHLSSTPVTVVLVQRATVGIPAVRSLALMLTVAFTRQACRGLRQPAVPALARINGSAQIVVLVHSVTIAR
jgi:hypothetical protein